MLSGKLVHALTYHGESSSTQLFADHIVVLKDEDEGDDEDEDEVEDIIQGSNSEQILKKNTVR